MLNIVVNEGRSRELKLDARESLYIYEYGVLAQGLCTPDIKQGNADGKANSRSPHLLRVACGAQKQVSHRQKLYKNPNILEFEWTYSYPQL